MEDQIPKAVAYAEEQASKILPAMRDGIRLVRQLDDRDRPFWINEAADSDMKYVRGFIDEIDVTGCDYYAVRSEGTDLQTSAVSSIAGQRSAVASRSGWFCRVSPGTQRIRHARGFTPVLSSRG